MQSNSWLILTFVALVRADDAPCIIAHTESGLVCGASKKAINGDDYASFLGIPYAKAPLGALRFAEPQPPEQFDGVFNATTPGPVCPQHPTNWLAATMNPTSMSEDCLHVNVHVPLLALPDPGAIEPRTPRPVLVFVHGGSFSDGSGDPDAYGPEYLMTTGIIVVTLNHRLNALGFLSLNSKKIPGNAALRDVLYALKWVQRNIKNFGGDPEQVTFGGVSAGSAVTHLVAISPAVKGLGLFKRVIVMSGTGISDFFSPAPSQAKRTSRIFIEGMGIDPSQSPEKIYQEIIRAPIEKILEANEVIRNHSSSGVGFVPVIETPREGFTTMVPKPPEELLKEGNGNEYPTLFGFSNSECKPYKHSIDKAQPVFRKFPFLTIPKNLLLTSNFLMIPLMTEMISREYFNGSLSTTRKYMNLCSDALYKYPVLRIVEERLIRGAEPSFVYEFGYEYEKNNPLKRIQQYNWTGVGHTEDLSYSFRANSLFPPAENDELAQNTTLSMMKRFMTRTVSNFVKFGHPGAKLEDWPETGYDFEMMSVAKPEPRFLPPTPRMMRMKTFFDRLYRIGRLQIFK